MAAYADLADYLMQMAQRHGALVIVQTILAIANTVANAFVMIYLLREDLSYIECSVFLLIAFIVAILFATFGSNLATSDLVRSMRIGMVLMAAYYVSLMLLSDLALTVIPPLFLGAYMVMFWVPYNSLISQATSQEKRGAGVGAYFLVFPAVSTIGPLAGGLIITLGSYDMLFAYGAAVICMNLAYLLRPAVLTVDRSLSVGEMTSQGSRGVLSFRGIDRRIGWGILAEGVQEGVFWMALPILSFEFATDEVALSGYLSLFAFWGALMTVALGYLSDRIRDRVKILRVSAALTAASLVVCALAESAEGYLMGMSAANFWLAVVPAFLFTMLVDRSEKRITRGMMAREALLNSGRAFGISMVILMLALDYDLSLTMLVAAAAVASVAAVK